MFLVEKWFDYLLSDNDGVITNFYIRFFLQILQVLFVGGIIYFICVKQKKRVNLVFTFYEKGILALKHKYLGRFVLLLFIGTVILHVLFSQILKVSSLEWVYPLYTILFVLVACNLTFRNSQIIGIVAKNKAVISVGIVVLPFLVSRLIFYGYFNYMYFHNDSPGYFALVQELNSGGLPNIAILRTLGYPLFVKICLDLHNSNTFVMLMQSMANLFAALFLLRSLALHFYHQLLAFALGLSFFLCSNEVLLFETSFATESLYVTGILIMLAFFLFSLKYHKPLHIVAFSVFVWVVMMIRPAGLYLAAILVLTAIYFYYKNRSIKLMVYTLLPFFICYLSTCAYNKWTHGRFKFTEFGAYTMLGASMTYLKIEDDTPPFLRKHLEQFQDSVLFKDINTVRNSWQLNRIQATYGKEYNNVWTLWGQIHADTSYQALDAPSYYLPDLLKRTATNSMKNEPELVLKYFISGLKPYYFENACSYDDGFYKMLLERHVSMCIDNKIIPFIQADLLLRKALYKEFYNTKPSSVIKETALSDSSLLSVSNKMFIKKPGKLFYIQNPIIQFVRQIREAIRRMFFFNNATFFTLCLFFVLIFSLNKLLRVDLSKNTMFIFFIFSVIPFLQGLLVCSFNYNDVRHSVTIEFLKYFSFIFLVMIIFEYLNKKRYPVERGDV
jgi:hypothetical protein